MRKMKVLFWNTHKNREINPILSELIIENDISIAVLAEYEAEIENLILHLSEQGKEMHQYFTVGCDRIKIIGSIKNVEPASQSDYASMQIVNKDVILCCIHLPSQIYSTGEGMRNIIISRTVSDICSVETDLNTKNTIVVGDFNINPYDQGCVGATLFHGMPVYCEAKRQSRTVAGQEFHMFYNPMWNFLGDFQKPYGTYYYRGNDTRNTYWHLYDQVIIRPALRNRFVDDSLKILTETQTRYLLNSNEHPDTQISDHLPIMFEIQEDYHGEET